MFDAIAATDLTLSFSRDWLYGLAIFHAVAFAGSYIKVKQDIQRLTEAHRSIEHYVEDRENIKSRLLFIESRLDFLYEIIKSIDSKL